MHIRRFLFTLFAVVALSPPFLCAQVKTSGTIPSTGGGASCVSINVDAQATVAIQVTGTWSGVLQPKISVQGQSPANIQVTPSTSSAVASTITANGVYRVSVAGGSTFLLCGNTVASGTANVYLNASTASAGSGLSSGGGTGGFVLTFSQAGLVSGDATDNTAALNTALTSIFNAGGGTLQCDQPGTYLFNSAQIQIPNDGGSWPDNGGTVPANKPLRISGQGIGVATNDSLSTGLTAASNGGCIFDMQFNATNAKIVTFGQGQLEIDHLTFVDNNTDCATFFLTTNTSLAFHENSVLGSTASNHVTPVYSCNDAIQLGGTGTTSNGTVTAIFQGYNTKIRNNFFDRVQRAVVGGNGGVTGWINSVTISDNVIWYNAGFLTGGAIELNCNVTFPCEANEIRNNLIETVNYKYGVALIANTHQNYLSSNSCWDSQGPFSNCVWTGGADNIIGGTCAASPGCIYAKMGATQTSTPGYFFAGSFENPNQETVGMGAFATTDLAGFGGWTGGVKRAYIGLCGSTCNLGGGQFTSNSILQSRIVLAANSNGAGIALIPNASTTDIYGGGSATTNLAFQVDNSANVNIPAPFGALMSWNKSACETSFAATTLATGATTTNTGLNCLPINAVIDSVVYRITTTITTAVSFTIGDGTTAARFCSTQSTMTAGTAGICFVQADQTGAAGPRQTAAAAVRITTNANPGAGAIRLIVYYHTWTVPTS
jgi:hypothetical protein